MKTLKAFVPGLVFALGVVAGDGVGGIYLQTATAQPKMEPGAHMQHHREHHEGRIGARESAPRKHHGGHSRTSERTHRDHHAARHGPEDDHGHNAAHMLPEWRETLTTEQRHQIETLHVAYAKSSMPLKARMRSIKTDLSAMATADEPDAAVMQQRIDELLGLKKQEMSLYYAHVADVRKLLTAEQRPAYDMTVLKRGKGRRHRD